MGRALARIEKKGIPTFTIARQGFKTVIQNCFQSMGFLRDAALIEFPTNMFLPDSKFVPVEENLDKLIFGLTQWKSTAVERKRPEEPKTIAVEGEDYADILDKMNSIFIQNNWGDGLPLSAPTAKKVDWILTGTDLPRDTVIGRVLPSGRNATVESLAVNLAMTDGRPEYMPLMIAVCRAMIDKRFRLHMMQATTCSSSIAAIVNGPMAKQIRLNSGYGCLGPHPWYPAGGRIGRAVRLMQQNVGSAPPELVSMANFGGPQKWANVFYAEDEEGIPEGWTTLSEDRGFARGSNVVTIHAIAGSTNITSIDVGDEKTCRETLLYYARMLGGDYGNILTNYSDNSSPGVMVMPRGIAQGLADCGWTKEKAKQFIWENSKYPWSMVSQDSHLLKRTEETLQKFFPAGEPWPACFRPEQLMISVAGGKQSGHGYWLRMGCCTLEPISVEIELPQNWDELIAQADKDLGPIPSA